MKRFFLFCAVFAIVFFLDANCFAFSLKNLSHKSNESDKIEKSSVEPEQLSIFRKAYPDVKFESVFDEEKNDFLITVQADNRSAQLYWAESRFLPKEKLSQIQNYRKILYKIPKEVPNPADFTSEQIEQIKQFTSKENRANGAIDPPFLYNVIYDVENRLKTESHIKKMPFLDGRTINVHEKIIPQLTRVSQRIMSLERTAELDSFFKTLTRTDGFSWRTVRDTQSRSFHGIGLAIDILPKGYYQKIIYWGWQKQNDPEFWWRTPLKYRWSPPQAVIDIFEEEGFVWGGKWIVWDNMHFEYRPELLIIE